MPALVLVAPQEARRVHDIAEDDGAGHGAEAAHQDRLQPERQGPLHALHRPDGFGKEKKVFESSANLGGCFRPPNEMTSENLTSSIKGKDYMKAHLFSSEETE